MHGDDSVLQLVRLAPAMRTAALAQLLTVLVGDAWIVGYSGNGSMCVCVLLVKSRLEGASSRSGPKPVPSSKQACG